MTKKDKTIQNLIYMALTLLLLLCLANFPYGYYQVVRFLSFAGFGYLAYLQYKSSNTDRMMLFGILVLLFQPFSPIALGRVIWNIIDVVVAGYLIYLLARSRK